MYIKIYILKIFIIDKGSETSVQSLVKVYFIYNNFLNPLPWLIVTFLSMCHLESYLKCLFYAINFTVNQKNVMIKGCLLDLLVIMNLKRNYQLSDK